MDLIEVVCHYFLDGLVPSDLSSHGDFFGVFFFSYKGYEHFISYVIS